MTVLGVDLGATNIKMILLHEDDTIEPLPSIPTRGEEGHDRVLARLIEACNAVRETTSIDAIGLGTPGLFDPETGIATLFTNLPGQWRGVPVRDRLTSGTGMAVTMINDARAFTLAEGTLGAGRGAAVMAGLTLGTGIGGGLLIDGRLHHGATGSAGEISHQTIDPDGEMCGCGNRGCAEAAARAETMLRLSGRSTLEEIYEGYADGDPACVDAVDRAASALGRAIANVIVVAGPDVVVVGGGVVAAKGEEVLAPIRTVVFAHTTLVDHERIRVIPAELGSIAGAVGAALQARINRP